MTELLEWRPSATAETASRVLPIQGREKKRPLIQWEELPNIGYATDEETKSWWATVARCKRGNRDGRNFQAWL